MSCSFGSVVHRIFQVCFIIRCNDDMNRWRNEDWKVKVFPLQHLRIWCTRFSVSKWTSDMHSRVEMKTYLLFPFIYAHTYKTFVFPSLHLYDTIIIITNMKDYSQDKVDIVFFVSNYGITFTRNYISSLLLLSQWTWISIYVSTKFFFFFHVFTKLLAALFLTTIKKSVAWLLLMIFC